MRDSETRSLRDFNTMFGWRDYREDGKQWVENCVKNSVFLLFGKQRKTEMMENPGENFPSGPINFFPPKSGGKLWRESCS